MSQPGGRAARIERARAQQRKEQLTRAARWTGIGAVAILVVAGAAYGISLIPDPPKTVHWHPTWEVYVNGANVRWASPRFDMQYMGAATHFHQPDDNTIHAEGKTDRLYLGRLFIALGGDIEDGKITLPQGVFPAPGTYVVNETHRLRVFVEPKGEEWREVEGDFAQLDFEDRMRVLVTYGDPTPEELEAQKASVQRAKDDAASAMPRTTPPP